MKPGVEDKRASLIEAATAVASAWQREYHERLTRSELVRVTSLFLRQKRARDGAQTGEHFLSVFGHVIHDRLSTLDELSLALYNSGLEATNRPGRPAGARQPPLSADEQAAVRDITHALASQFAEIEAALS